MRRKRRCSECEKPLAGTIDKCHDCGGKSVTDPPGTQNMYDLARWWKIEFGIRAPKIQSAHNESKERNPRWDNEEEEWKHEL